MSRLLDVFWHYLVGIAPALAIGFLLSGLLHEFVPNAWVERNLGKKGLAGVFYATIVGTILPVCCWGSLPIAVTFYRKGSRLGPVLAFLVATPATSVSALLVTYKLLGIKFTGFIFVAVVVMGMIIGIIGNRLKTASYFVENHVCPSCGKSEPHTHPKPLSARLRSVLKFAFLDMPKEIGLETLIGIGLAALVASFVPIGSWIRQNLAGAAGYGFALVFGLIMYICSTATVPLVDALIANGLSSGAGMTLLLAGPVTSYGTILVIRKQFGLKPLLIYLAFVSVASLGLGYLFSVI